MSQWSRGQIPDGEQWSEGVHSSIMMGEYELAFNRIRKLINIQTICHTDYDEVILEKLLTC